MAVADDIAAARSRAVPAADMRGEVYRIKATALRDNLVALVGQTATFDGVDITLTRTPQYDGARGWLMVWCEVTRDGEPVPLDLPLCFVNPPIMAPTGPNGEMREDLRGAALAMIRGVVG